MRFSSAVALMMLLTVGLLSLADDKDSSEEAAPAAGLKKAFVDGSGPDWRQLGGDDFVTVNGDEDTWVWKDGVGHCKGTPTGVTRSTKEYTNFELVCEWRHLKPAGNSGVFVWTQPESLKDLPPGRLPKGIEVQVLDNDFTRQYEERTGKKGEFFSTHGDVFPVGSKLTPFPPLSPNGSRSFPSKNLSKSSPEWNHYYVRAINGEVRLWVNGEEVSGGTGADPATGYLCLESEGSPVEFRNIRIRELP